MKRSAAIITLLIALLLTGCLNRGDPMVLLDENIEQVDVSYSRGGGMINDDILYTYSDEAAIQSFQQIITSARKRPVEITTAPDYDIVVSYGEHWPLHGIHVWLGEEGEESVFSYLADFEETYVTNANTTKQLRELVERE
ncbi:hypothetical protein PQ478_10710 [Alkalihalophilus pseudofirmus]|uniref:hypothetical protein n=1 Tax=Alkalihalophilus pseudofirmus TaxID=79885 RepID=UPI00259AEBD1|nr:hypothetical protein [Alkalihalophilus pseudofirmus]WEG18930.1 hypothetical protein PQ478_10710 [Alkalihalophilus pseudofirmus]